MAVVLLAVLLVVVQVQVLLPNTVCDTSGNVSSTTNSSRTSTCSGIETTTTTY